MSEQPQKSREQVIQLIDSRKPGFCLEADLYRDDQVYQADVENIFGKHWLFVGVEGQIPEEGDYFTIDIDKRSVIIVRDDDMNLKAFHNVCRHRGSRLCEEHQGSVGNLVCPYHQWTYNLEGNLISAEHMQDDFDKSQYSLKSVHVRSLEGLIFICMADEAPADFEDMAKDMAPYLKPNNLPKAKVAAIIDIVENGNWKLTMENNRECYHCVANHPELTVSLYQYGFGYKPNPNNMAGIQAFYDKVKACHIDWENQGLPSAEIDHLDDRITAYRTMRLPLDHSGQSQTMNTEVACKIPMIGDGSDKAYGGLSFWAQPNFWSHFMSDHVICFSVLPIAPNRTMLRTIWCVHPDAVEGKDYDVDNLTSVWKATNAQDSHLVEETFVGVSNPDYAPGPYSPFTEELVDKFCNWYVKRMQATMK